MIFSQRDDLGEIFAVWSKFSRSVTGPLIVVDFREYESEVGITTDNDLLKIKQKSVISFAV